MQSMPTLKRTLAGFSFFPCSRRAAIRYGILVILSCSIALGQTMSPEVRALIQSGNSALDAGDFRKAAQQFEAARTLVPDNIDVSRGLLETYLQLGRSDLAIPIGAQAVQSAPKDARIHHWLGLAYFKTQQNDLARQELEKAAGLEPNNADIPFDLAVDYVPQLLRSPDAHLQRRGE